MTPTALKLFVTGDPGCGKTTLIRRVVDRLRGSVTMQGFLTEEVLNEGRRAGFRGTTLDGQSFPLADRSGEGDLRVGPYSVQLEGLESIGVPALTPRAGAQLIVLDEVGKMEVFSTPFRERVEALLGDKTPMLATVAGHGVGFIKRIRQDPRVSLVRMRRRARDGMVGEILRRLEAAGISAARPSAAGPRNRKDGPR